MRTTGGGASGIDVVEGNSREAAGGEDVRGVRLIAFKNKSRLDAGSLKFDAERRAVQRGCRSALGDCFACVFARWKRSG